MSNDAWNKIEQTHDLFKKIIAPLKEHLGINFGYMIVFNDGSYYQIIKDLDCLKKWVTNVETSHIFCARNVTTYFDEPYNFTIWPEEPTCPAMEIYKEYGMWNGITISKINKNYTELYWFTKENAEDGWHKWFIRNKQFLLELVKYFLGYKDKLQITDNHNYMSREMFKFIGGFKTSIPDSEYLDIEQVNVNNVRDAFQLNYFLEDNLYAKVCLSQREIEVLSMMCRGYNYKIIAQKLKISTRTIRFHTENIKCKTGVKSKTELIKLLENKSLLKMHLQCHTCAFMPVVK